MKTGDFAKENANHSRAGDKRSDEQFPGFTLEEKRQHIWNITKRLLASKTK